MSFPDLSALIHELTDTLVGWAEAFFAMLPNLAVAIVIMAVFWVAARPVSRGVRTALDRVSNNQQINQLLGTSVRLVILGVGLFIALGVLQLDKTVTSLLAGIGVVGLALGFAFQDLATNLISGILLSVQQPFHIGDIVEAGGEMGTVERTSLRSTDLRRFTGQIVIVPNKDLFQNPLVNYSRSGLRRVEVAVGVTYDQDLREARRVTLEALEGLDCRREASPPEVFFTGFGGSSIDLVARFWIDFHRQVEFTAATSDAIIAIKEAYDAAGIEIPFPIRTLDLGASSRDAVSRLRDALDAA